MASNAFDSSEYASANLHVPAASLKSYRTTKPWSNFKYIMAMSEEEEMTEVNPIDNVQTAIESVFDLNGRQQSNMQKGINILRMNNGTTRKIVVR